MKLAPTTVVNKIARQVLVARKHSPVLMFSTGIVGAVGATVLACRATLKLEEVVAKTEKDMERAKELARTMPEEYSERDRNRDLAYLRVRTVVNITKLYAPAVGVGVLSIGLLTGSHVVLTRRNVALTAAYGALEKGFNEYRARVREEYGEDKERELRYGALEKEIVEEGEHGHEVKTIKRINPVTGKSIYAQVFDETNKNWQRSPVNNHAFLKAQQNYANHLLNSRGYVFLNEVYDALGLERTKSGQVVGWLKGNGDDYISFGIFEKSVQAPEVIDFFNGDEGSIWLDFNVDGSIWDKL